MLLSAGLTALIGLNGSVAALLPMAVVMALRRSFPPSRLLMPLAFAGSAGGLLLLTGSPVNVVISQAAADAGVGSFGFAEFAIVGIPLVVGTVGIVLAFGDRLLPDRTSTSVPPDLSGLARTLVRCYSLDDVAHLRVTADVESRRDTAVGMGSRRLRPGSHHHRSRRHQRAPRLRRHAGGRRSDHDGRPARRSPSSTPSTTDCGSRGSRTAADVEQTLLSRDSGAAEVVMPPRSVHVGTDLQPSQVIDGSLIVLAITRSGEDLGADPVRVRAGDILLLEGPWAALDAAAKGQRRPRLRFTRARATPDRPARSRLAARHRRASGDGGAPRHRHRARRRGSDARGRSDAPPSCHHGRAGLPRDLVDDGAARRRHGAMSTAVSKSGAGEKVANVIVDAVGDRSPTVLLIALFIVTVTFGQLISNTATALIMIPIAVSAADQLDVSARPVLMSLCVAAAVAFLTPVSTPANMMVMGPAGYRFGDYWKLGLPLVLLFGVVSVFLVPLVWRF